MIKFSGWVRWNLCLTLVLASCLGSVYAVDYPAIIHWSKHAKISSPESGVIKEVLVHPGKRVDKGQTLLSLDTNVFKAELEKAKAEFDFQLLLYKEANKELQRAQELYDSTVLSDHELELAKINFAKSNALYEVAKANKVYATESFYHSTVRAPFKGIILKSNVEDGQVIVNKLQSVVLFELVDIENLIARTELEIDKVGFYTIGHSLSVQISGKIYKGTVYFIGLEPTTKGGDRYILDVLFRTDGDVIRVGQSATLRFD